jgi:hypothetical protein
LSSKQPSINLTFTVRPGTVTGKRYAEHAVPLHEVGALLEAKAVHTGRSAYHHLSALASTHGISRKRVDEVIDLVGLRDVAGKRIGGFSLGMGQRLGVACALLADPATLTQLSWTLLCRAQLCRAQLSQAQHCRVGLSRARRC